MSRRACPGDLGALAADMLVVLGPAQHEVERYAANLRAIHHQLEALWLGVLTTCLRQWFIAIERQDTWQAWQASMHSCISELILWCIVLRFVVRPVGHEETGVGGGDQPHRSTSTVTWQSPCTLARDRKSVV